MAKHTMSQSFTIQRKNYFQPNTVQTVKFSVKWVKETFSNIHNKDDEEASREQLKRWQPKLESSQSRAEVGKILILKGD